MMMNNFKFNFNNLSSYNRICKIKSTYLNCNSKVIKCQGMKSIRFLNLLIYEYRDVVVKGTQTLKKRMLRVITLQLDRNNNTSISTIHIRYNVNPFRRISKHSFFFFKQCVEHTKFVRKLVIMILRGVILLLGRKCLVFSPTKRRVTYQSSNN